MQYYGNANSMSDQTQSFNVWYFYPLRINFGSAHEPQYFVVEVSLNIPKLTSENL